MKRAILPMNMGGPSNLNAVEVLQENIKKQGFNAKVITLDSYYKHPDYIAAMMARIQETLGTDNPDEFELVFSAQGLPQKVIDKVDNYQRHIKYNVFYARKALHQAGLHFYNTHLAYQSRLGPLDWIRPYLEDKLKSLKKKKVIIYPIAFTTDNSETEFELDVKYTEEISFEECRVAKTPNDHPLFVKCITSMKVS